VRGHHHHYNVDEVCLFKGYTFFHLQMAYLEVVIPPDIISEETSGDVMVPEGGNAKLICRAKGYPKPIITWRKEDGNPIIIKEHNGHGGKRKGKDCA
jgi:neurotrimin